MADLIVKGLNGQSELLTDSSNIEIYEEVNGGFSISFTSFFTEKNTHAYDLLNEESIVEFNGHEFRVKKLSETLFQKTITEAPHIFFDLIDDRIYTINGGTKTVDEFFAFTLNGTGWTFENVDVTRSMFIPNFGNDNIIALIRTICEAFSCEIKIEPNKTLKVYQQIGEDNDVQFRYRKNVKKLKRDVDTTKLATVIKGFGADGLEVTYTSPNVSIFGEIHAEPVTDERFTIAESLIEKVKQTIIDYPEVSIEVEQFEIEGVNLGDFIWLIYEPLQIEFQTRVMALKIKPDNLSQNVITLGNIRHQITDLLTETRVEIDKNKKQIQSRIEQTNERITLEVEAVNESIASIQLENDQIELRVEDMETSVSTITQRADSIELSVQTLDNRVDSAESSLSVQAGQISTKVEKNGVISAINQTAESIKLSATRIDLDGITRVNGNLYIGDIGSGMDKSIIFSSSARINSGYNFGIEISANNTRITDGSVYLGSSGGGQVNVQGYLNATGGHNIVAKFG